ncbi:MAG: DUF1559 domain-containing protein [Thermoguttaceae bacterium]
MNDTGPATWNGLASDYAVIVAADRTPVNTGVFRKDWNTPAPVGGGNIRWTAHTTNTEHGNRPCTPIRGAMLMTAGDENTWSSRDTFSRMIDGTSNQFLIGEKHIPVGLIGQCRSATGDVWVMTGETTSRVWDCGIQSGRGGTPNGSGFSAVRYPHNETDFIARSPNDGTVGGTLWRQNHVATGPSAAFGSYHVGTCIFLLGDGSVYPVSPVTSVTVLRAYTDVADGSSLSLP